MIISCISSKEGEISLVVNGEIIFPIRFKEGDIVLVNHRFDGKLSDVAQSRHVSVETQNSGICLRPGRVLLQDKNNRFSGCIHDLLAANKSGLNWVVN